MNTTVWVLVALVYSGHISYSFVPTLEFTTEQKCISALLNFQAVANTKTVGSFNGYCVRVDK